MEQENTSLVNYIHAVYTLNYAVIHSDFPRLHALNIIQRCKELPTQTT